MISKEWKRRTFDLFLQQTVENEDEHPLQGVEDGEEVRHHYGGFIEEEQAKGPREPQQTEEGERSQHPRPAKRERRSILTSETAKLGQKSSLLGLTFLSSWSAAC